MFNVDGLRFINYLDDQSEFVAAYIEHRAFADQIGMRIIDFGSCILRLHSNWRPSPAA